MAKSVILHPDRLFPSDTGVRNIARALHSTVENLPIISPHGHVDAHMIADDTPFPDPTALLLSPDHYVTRLLHSHGVPLDQLRVGGSTGATAREAWTTLCTNWNLLDGTASGYWLSLALATVFGIDEVPTASNATELYDAVSEFWLDGFSERAERLIQEAGDGLAGYNGYIQGMANRRQYFVEHGAVSSDHGVHTPRTVKLDQAEAARLFEKGIAGTATREEALIFEANMTYQQATMAVEDGLVMTMHPGIHRNAHAQTLAQFGPDTGHDIPFAVDYATGLQPLLNDFGTAEGFHFIPFTTDETVFSREIAPLAGFYPSVFIGAPWWFLDAPDSMLRFRSAVTETAGFSRSSGSVDDTRAFCSIPARHDASRRVEASFLARLVAEHRVSQERAHEIIIDLVDTSPRRAFKMGERPGG